MRPSKNSCVQRRGLVLLIVLGMIAMFSLLAVTYVVMTGDSRDASRAVLRGERLRNFDLDAIGRSVLTNMMVGTNDQQSPFYAQDLFGDVYGRQSFVTRCFVFNNDPAWQLMDLPTIGAASIKLPDFCFVKLTLNPQAENGFSLSEFENEYNSRILTVLEGPLSGQSFRIVKYIGHVNPAAPVPDPNVDTTPWSTRDYADPSGLRTAYSVVIDLNEIQGERFTGTYFPPSSLDEKSITLSPIEWIKQFGVQSLFYKPRPTAGAPYEGFRVLINGAPFNSVGIGLEDIAQLPSSFVRGFGNIDSKRIMGIPSSPARRVSPALLPHYDYLNDPSVMAANPLMGGDIGVDGVGTPRNNLLEHKLMGQSNEGYDVPDYRDHWLASVTHINPSPGLWTRWVKPSYHQPAVIQYLAHLFGPAASLTPAEAAELTKLVDLSTSRVLSYGNVNPNFKSRTPGYPRLQAPFTAADLRNFIRSQIEGPWDVDNDGDGIPDSVWIDPRMPVVYGPEGQRLKPLVAILTVDLDGRVNMNAAGERIEGLSSMFPLSAANFKQGANNLLPTGFGYGPKEISLARLLSTLPVGPLNAASVTPVLKSGTTRYSFFDELYGMRRSPVYGRLPIDFTSSFADRSPGRRGVDDHVAGARHRENYVNSRTLPAFPIGRRGAIGLSFDNMGNPAFVVRADTDVIPTNPTLASVPNELVDDGYEFAPMGRPISDDPLSLTDLEAILRRYDADASSLPKRLREVLENAGFTDINNHIYDAVTTRSGELRYPNLGAAMAVGTGTNRVALHEAPSLLKYLQWLHDQRHRAINADFLADPEISYAALTELFASDFAAGLRMDLNRPFGNGLDSDGLGLPDDPLELATTAQLEDGVGTPGAYARELYSSATKPGSPPVNFPSVTRGRLGSRQILARHLYCLAQLIVPLQHNFPGMEDVPFGNNARFLRRAQMRAKAIAQWAVNVVDFRDSDSVMTRFEYDIFPFGLGVANAAKDPLIAPRPAYWAPDHVGDAVNGIPNKNYCGVVWGMELPELLLSETLAFHDKKVRDTDMDSNSRLVADGDPDYDQYRFPQSSLFIEVRAARTAENPEFFTPGVGRLYRFVDGEMHLDLAAMAPAAPGWGQQPVWRIAISEDYEAAGVDPEDRPLVESDSTGTPPPMPVLTRMRRVTNQFSFERFGANLASMGNPDLASSTTIEEYLGNGLIYDPLDPASMSPSGIAGFERFVWFTRTAPTGDIPDILPSIRARPSTATSNWQHSSVYRVRGGSLTDNAHLLRGGEFLVVAPRLETPIGSLTHNPFEGNLYPITMQRTNIAASPQNRPVNAPSRQRISLTPDASRPFDFPIGAGNRTVRTYSMNGTEVNQEWWINSRRPKALVCAVPAPDDPAAQNYFDSSSGTDWDLSFPNGVGLNISFPTPIHNEADTPVNYWYRGHRPSVRLNSLDRLVGGSTRTDGTLGFGDDAYLVSNPNGAFFPPDSWVDTANPVTNFPDRPFDLDNPYIGGAGRYRSRTYENVRTAYLQRLADPEFPYDPTANPYITVDWMPIDLTVFNGEASSTTDPLDGGTLAGGQWGFQSRYKDGRLTPIVANSDSLSRQAGVSIYSPHTPGLRLSVPQPPPAPLPASPEYPAGLNYQPYFTHVLGYDAAVTWGGAPQASGTTLGYPNVGFHTGGGLLEVSAATDNLVDGFGIPRSNANIAFQGATPFLQGLFWTNRPFASPYETMMVPATGPGSFGLFHSGFRNDERHPFAFLPSYQASNAWNFTYPTDDHTRSYWAISEPANGTNYEGDWGLILDFVETKPPFIDAEKRLNPLTVFESMGGGGSTPAWAGVANRFLNSFIPQGYYNNAVNNPSPSRVRGPTLLAPFNSLPTFVNAGKINLNTVTVGLDGRSKALESLEQHYLRGADVAALFNSYRAGYDTTDPSLINSFFNDKILHFNPNLPTDYAGAFRPSMTSNIAPELHNVAATGLMRNRWNAQTGLMRAADLAAGVNNTPSAAPPVFNSLPNAHGPEVLNGQPFARYQRLMRLPNLVTNQSNIFASWVTISLFEYDPETGFGNEYVSPSGEPISEKYFYLIDRTVPVGYSPGERLNMERAILQKKL
ncbi:hypothetical protein SH449x_001529 [Pirellulaceae bacterium SH449]